MAEQTILIAEDDPDIRDGVRILLSGEAHAKCRGSGRKARGMTNSSR